MSWENYKANNGSDDHYNQLEKVKTHFIVNKEAIKKHWNGISIIPNPFGAFSFTFIANDAGIYYKTSNFEKNRGGHHFSSYDPNSFCKLLF